MSNIYNLFRLCNAIIKKLHWRQVFFLNSDLVIVRLEVFEDRLHRVLSSLLLILVNVDLYTKDSFRDKRQTCQGVQELVAQVSVCERRQATARARFCSTSTARI